MLNPVQEYAKARSMPIPALVAVLQGQSDMVSLGVAHAALKEKTEAEIARKGADASMMAQAPKVIDRDVAMAQGIAGMPSDVDVPMGGIVGQDGQMTDMAAGGGIVAFQAGGDPRAMLRRVPADPRFGQPPPGIGVSPAAAPATRGFMDYVRGAGRSLGRFLPGFSLATATDGLNVNQEEQLDIYRTLLGLGYTEEDVRNMPAEMRKQIVNTVKQSQAQQTQQAPQVPPENQRQQIQDQGQQVQDQGQRQQAPGGIAALPGAQQTRSAPSSYSDLMTKARAMAAGVMSDAEPTKTAKQFMDDYRTMLGQAGFDFNLAKDEIAAVRAEKEALKGSKKEAANLRLIEAGLGILGGESPYAFVNIGKGASPALKGLSEDLKDIQKESRALDRDRRQLMLMQNEIAAGQARYGLDAVSKQQDRIAQRENAIANREVSIFTALTNADTQRYVAKTNRDTQREVAVMQASALKAERDLARQDKRAEVALDAAEQAARDIMDPSEKTTAIKKYFREFYGAAYGSGATAAPRAQGKIVNGVYVPAGQ